MIWLVVPTAWEGLPGAGQWKDLHGIRLVLTRLGNEWREFRFHEDNISELIARIGSANDTVIWYYTFGRKPWRTAALLSTGENRLTVNAEARQHWTRAENNGGGCAVCARYLWVLAPPQP